MSISRLAQAAIVDPAPDDFEDEELLSGGEGDDAMQEVDDQEGYTSSTPTSTLTWISWFCSLPGHEYFCEVAEEFIEDDFNMTGLAPYVPFWKEALEMVLDVDPDEDSSKIPDVSIVEQSAEILYGLVHARYLLTRQGLQAMVEKYEAGIFGTCPRVLCHGAHVVPCGRSDLPSMETVKLFCPNCLDIYSPPSTRFQSIDAAYFGTTFSHLFFQSYRELLPAPFYRPSSSERSSLSPGHSPQSASSGLSPGGGAPPPAPTSAHPPFANPNPNGGQKRPAGAVYQPRIYGFKVSERAKSGPRMQWLRVRPESPAELEKVDWRGRWIDDEEGYEDEEEEEGEGGDRHMEAFFDPDMDDDEDDEEEEQEEDDAVQAARPPAQHRRRAPGPGEAAPGPAPTHASPSAVRTLPTAASSSSSVAWPAPLPSPPEEKSSSTAGSGSATTTTAAAGVGVPVGAGRLRAVRQWVPAEAWARTAQV